MNVPEDRQAELYVYYRLPRLAATTSRAEVKSLQQQLCLALPGLQARCLERLETNEPECLTWMETYRHPQGLSPAACAFIEQAAASVPTARSGTRHTEVFDAWSPLG
jgi:hypothetical protein